jgi:antitoxin CptB
MDNDQGRLRWRCRRGMKELDLLLRGYVDAEYPHALPEQQEAFRRLLECPDPLIYDYLLGRTSPPDQVLAALIQRIAAARAAGG